MSRLDDEAEAIQRAEAAIANERAAVVRWLNARAVAYTRTNLGAGAALSTPETSLLREVIEGLAAAIERGSHRGPR